MTSATLALSPNKQRLLVLTLALLVRGFCGYISFGTIDLVNAIWWTQPIYQGQLMLDVPYFPTIA